METSGEDTTFKEDEVTDETAKEEKELATFWKESDELVHDVPTGHKLKDIAKYEVTITDTLPAYQTVDDIDSEKKVHYMLHFSALAFGLVRF